MGVKARRLPDIIGFLITVWWRGFESHSCQYFFGLVLSVVFFSGRHRELAAGIKGQGAEGKLDSHIFAPLCLHARFSLLNLTFSLRVFSILRLRSPVSVFVSPRHPQAHMPVRHS